MIGDFYFNRNYPSVSLLRERAKYKMPRFAFEYLDGGCNDDVNLRKNTAVLREVELKPQYLQEFTPPELTTTLFGKSYSAPFGIAPVGLQGLMWPNAPEILAKAAFKHNIPFILSTVTTSNIERIAQLTEGEAWFQLYHPAKETLTKDLLRRASETGYKVLVIIADVPSFGFRPRDIKNGLSMPPKMTLSNILDMFQCPEWCLKTLIHGKPEFASLKPYIKKGSSMKALGKFMDATFEGRLSVEKLTRLRELWPHKLVLKGVESLADVEAAHNIGVDGVIVSNHGGRQHDAGEATVTALSRISKEFKGKLTLMMDSGIRGGADVGRAMASGADFTFLGRSFMYGVGALGNKGGEHTASLIKTELLQQLEQLNCKHPSELIRFNIKS